MSNRNFAQNFARRLARPALGRGRIQVAVDCALIAGDGMTTTREAAALIRGIHVVHFLPGSWPYGDDMFCFAPTRTMVPRLRLNFPPTQTGSTAGRAY